MNLRITDKELKTKLPFISPLLYPEAFAAGIQIGQWMKSKACYAVAANQLGLTLRLFVVRKAKQNGMPTDVFINPTYVAAPDSRRKLSGESCLSFPGKRFEIARDTKIRATWYDPRLRREITDTIEGLPAVIFQHETDHLNGIDDEHLAKSQEEEVKVLKAALVEKFKAIEAEFMPDKTNGVEPKEDQGVPVVGDSISSPNIPVRKEEF